MNVIRTKKIHEADENILDLIESGTLSYVISTSSKGRLPTRDGVIIRRKAVERSVPCLTALDTANAVVESLRHNYTQSNTHLYDINQLNT
jgi:carbamoyl-phosphate synthase large subunit